LAIVNIKETLDADIETVWEAVTSLKSYAWRSDLDNIEIGLDGKQFVEKTKDGYSTTFTITDFMPRERYAFSIENDNIQGSWTGIFSSVDGKTVVDFTENVEAKRVLLRPFVKTYLVKQQKRYIRDLQRYLAKAAK